MLSTNKKESMHVSMHTEHADTSQAHRYTQHVCMCAHMHAQTHTDTDRDRHTETHKETDTQRQTQRQTHTETGYRIQDTLLSHS